VSAATSHWCPTRWSDDLGLVGEEHVDLGLDEAEELLAMAIDAERVGQRERDPVAGLVGEAGRQPVRLLGLGLVPEVSLEVEHLGTGDEVVVDVARAELRRRAEVGVHGALRVGRHDDEAATARLAAARGLGPEVDAGGPDVVAEHDAELVVGHPADERGTAAERRHADQRVGGGATGDLDRRPHRGVEHLGTFGVDQLHRARREVMSGEELVLLVAEHVDQRVADADDVDPIAHDARLLDPRKETGTAVAAAAARSASCASGGGRRRRPSVWVRP
jgi:hypothetical protein